MLAVPAAAGAQGDEPPLESQFEKVTLNDRPGEPVARSWGSCCSG
jgi:hypothetical protein